MEEHSGIAFIIEKESNHLIANSIGADNYTMLQNGTLKRNGLDDIDNSDIQKAYIQYKENDDSTQFYKGKNDNFFVNTKELHMAGIDWIVISAIPESIFMTDIYFSMYWTGLIVALSLLMTVLIYNFFMTKYLKPLKSLLQATSEFAAGDLSRRFEIVRNDEIGLIAKSVNSMSDTMQLLIENLEATVQKRTQELNNAKDALQARKDELRLILDTAAEAIYGIDVNGNCTFCNKSCVTMLGYSHQSELLGKNMHRQIHHSRRDGTPIAIEDCTIFKAFQKGEGTHVEHEVFWRADGTPFDVEYFSYPQKKNGKITGAVVTFLDISKRKQKEAEVEYLFCYDVLTGLLNRRCFEESRIRIDTPDNLPISVIFADINGLKMTNDIFGHGAGDALIIKSSEILKQVCRKHDVVARIGGDEFIILLPNTTEEDANKVAARIRSEFANARVEAIKCTISLGVDTKKHPDQQLEEIMTSAENAMYKDKTINRSSVNKDIIDTIVEVLHSKAPEEKRHSVAVGDLCAAMGTALRLSENKISKLIRAGYLHDIGKIVLDESLLAKDVLSDEELEKMQQHSVVGYRILNLFDDTLDLAEYVYGHHERWDGTGYPRGLKSEQIPLISRIIAVTETYDRVFNRGELPYENQKSAALDVIKGGAGTQFDPEIANLFVQMMTEKR